MAAKTNIVGQKDHHIKAGGTAPGNNDTYQSPNRTILELKHSAILYGGIHKATPNRTILEPNRRRR
ncbi:hypothetical protein SAMN05216323_11211 [Williamwhitmania taraxaci]|uniref:Uncharacterized protein n=1 Tax=Williamwhitmania taraxaci TaxID=1640674 RepID=A0A1G6TG58_9BACT|nr:hypothetical protein SAMN05216323_11211 [Williamwhitmania taraxaci]